MDEIAFSLQIVLNYDGLTALIIIIRRGFTSYSYCQ